MNETELIEKLKKARGAQYVKLFREANATIGERLRREVCEKREREGKVPIWFLGTLSLRENLPVKTLCRMLEDGKALPTGVHDELIRRGVTVARVLEEARNHETAPQQITAPRPPSASLLGGG